MEDLRENIDLVNQNENRASAISFNPYAVYLNGAPGIYGSPFEINLGHKKQVGKILQVQENTYKLVKFDYEGYDGDLSVSISNGSKIEYFLSRNYHDPNCNEYEFYFDKSFFKIRLPSTLNSTMYMKILAKSDTCEFEIWFQCGPNKNLMNQIMSARHDDYNYEGMHSQKINDRRYKPFQPVDNVGLIHELRNMDIFAQFDSTKRNIDQFGRESEYILPKLKNHVSKNIDCVKYYPEVRDICQTVSIERHNTKTLEAKIKKTRNHEA